MGTTIFVTKYQENELRKLDGEDLLERLADITEHPGEYLIDLPTPLTFARSTQADSGKIVIR